jgi:aminomethyltransferase
MTISKFYTFLKPKMGSYGKFVLPLSYNDYSTKDVVINTRKSGFTTVFDVSHMGIFETLINHNSINDLSKLLNIDLNKLRTNKSKLSVIIDKNSNVIDDLIISNIDDKKFRLVVNANNKSFFKAQNYLIYKPKNIIALQGKGSQDTIESMFNFKLDDVYFMENKNLSSGFEICRCGYTGEDGFELYLDDKTADIIFWELLKTSKYDNRIQFGGLIARDILRLEAGMNLSGNEFGKNMDINFNALNMNFLTSPIYRKNLNLVNEYNQFRFSSDKPIKTGKIYSNNQEVGFITSATKSFNIDKFIAIGYLNTNLINVSDSLSNLYSLDNRNKVNNIYIHHSPFIDTSYYKNSK